MTVPELKTYAADHSINLSGARLKADIVDTITLGME